MSDQGMSDLHLTPAQLDAVLSPHAIREAAAKIFARTERGQGQFRFHPEKLDDTVDFVLRVIRKKYPDLNIPFHSRWGHFRAGGVDRARQFQAWLDQEPT
ncbi:MAG: URC4/urg3 family protein, partial [Bdellovibrionaceae bacterium]|nr:URC4/urg3 family protein [Pseudobdellovibrionaceae bacterium]